MSLCCTTYINLGCFNSCDPVNTGIMVEAAGVYTIQLEFNNGITEINLTLGDGEEIIIDTTLNENYIYTFRVLNEAGEVVNETCYRFQTQLIDDRVTTHEIIYLNNVAELTISGTGSDELAITLVNAEYTGTDTPVYRVNDGLGGTFVITEGIVSGMDVSNYEDGSYTGYIYCDDGYTISKLYFVFSIVDFLITDCMPMCKFLLDNFAAGNNMTVDIITQTQSANTDITQTITKVNNVTQDTVNYSPAVNDTGINTNVYTAAYSNSLQTVTHGIEYDGHGILFSHISFFKFS